MDIVDGFGTYGFNGHSQGTGILGVGNNIEGQFFPGGSGVAGTSTNVGVYGKATNVNGSIGVLGISDNSNGVGVYGQYPVGGGAAGYFTGDVVTTGGFFTTSDRRFKKDIDTIKNALKILGELKPMQYEFDLDKYPYAGLKEGKSFGFMADELETVLPELVRESNINLNATKKNTSKTESNVDWQTFQTVNYVSLVPILTKAIQEQQKLIDSQQKRMDNLQKHIDSQQQTIDLLMLQLESVNKRLDALDK